MTKTADYVERLQQLEKSSRVYNRMSAYNPTELSKIWNDGRGCTKFIEVLPDEKIILYNTLVTNKRDIQKIRNVFPEYTLQAVDLPYWSHDTLSYQYRKQNEQVKD